MFSAMVKRNIYKTPRAFVTSKWEKCVLAGVCSQTQVYEYVTIQNYKNFKNKTCRVEICYNDERLYVCQW